MKSVSTLGRLGRRKMCRGMGAAFWPWVLCLALLLVVDQFTGAQGNEGEATAAAQGNCFELPEVADGELTGLIDDECEQRDFLDLVEPDCKEQRKLQYRTIDGSCNNLQNPRWGKSFEPQKRLLPAQLVDGHLPRSLARSGNPLPMVRNISKTVSPMTDNFAGVTNMVMAWGQFIDHDFTGTPVIKNGTQKLKCCGDIAEELKLKNGGPCFPIQLPAGDPLGRTCMEFVRSQPYVFPNGTLLEPREQLNTLTSFLDASAVYGNTQAVLDKLRGEKGTMKVTENNMLPEDRSQTCKKEREGDYCMLAGDHRVNVFVSLGALHTAFVREHNRIVSILRDLNPSWDDEILFQEARRIVSAQFQHITYAEWLPLVLDDTTMTKYRLKEGDFLYDPEVDPTVTNVFSTAAFRFGHSQVKQEVKIGADTLQLQDTLMRPKFTLHNMADIIHGIVAEPTDVVDNFFVVGLTDHMFETNTTLGDGLDLVAVNMHRGRDHGLPPYNDWREFCQLPRITDLSSPELIVDLSSSYEHPDDVDLFVGLVSETHITGSLVGPTLACLLGDQFRAMKFGDRFFYETDDLQERFTTDQLREIKQVTLAKILCDNIPDLNKIQSNVFRMRDHLTNPLESCDSLPGMDLNKWKSSSLGPGMNHTVLTGFIIALSALLVYFIGVTACILLARKRRRARARNRKQLARRIHADRAISKEGNGQTPQHTNDHLPSRLAVPAISPGPSGLNGITRRGNTAMPWDTYLPTYY